MASRLQGLDMRAVALSGLAVAIAAILALPIEGARADATVAKAKVVLVSATWSPDDESAEVTGGVETRRACRGNRVVRIIGPGDEVVRTRTDAAGDFTLADVAVPSSDAEYDVVVTRKRVRSGGVIRCRADSAHLSYLWVESGAVLSFNETSGQFEATIGGQDPTCVSLGEFPVSLYRNTEFFVGGALIHTDGTWEFDPGPEPAAGSYDLYVPPFSPAISLHDPNGDMTAAACAAIDSNEVILAG